jgi:hypothetical protein
MRTRERQLKAAAYFAPRRNSEAQRIARKKLAVDFAVRIDLGVRGGRAWTRTLERW